MLLDLLLFRSGLLLKLGYLSLQKSQFCLFLLLDLCVGQCRGIFGRGADLTGLPPIYEALDGA